ncbi:Plant cysteine oxidase 2 [Nymphaea thermarum]|nr:Plant cysteine oxidase 2 [Nymphaea thermarum]
MTPADIGLSEDFYFNSNRPVNETPRMRYMHIDECGNLFSIGVFLLPQSATIPLHDHPGMTVFTKLLFGSVRLRAYDWVEPFEPEDDLPSHVALAKLKVDDVFRAPCNAFVLYPASGGNLHCLQAVTPCAVLDVLGPPYSVHDGRDSTYYQEFPYSSFSGAAHVAEDETDQYRWLKKIEQPSLQVGPADYAGPEIVKGF